MGSANAVRLERAGRFVVAATALVPGTGSANAAGHARAERIIVAAVALGPGIAMAITQIHTDRRNRHGSGRDSEGGALDTSQLRTGIRRCLHRRQGWSATGAPAAPAHRMETATPGDANAANAGRRRMPSPPSCT